MVIIVYSIASGDYLSSIYEAENIPNDFAQKYPNITDWADGGTIKIDSPEWGSVYDEGGTDWEGRSADTRPLTMHQDAKRAIKKWLKENT